MTVRFSSILLITFAMLVTHLYALIRGLYAGKGWIDMPLHFTGGLLLALIGIWLVEHPRGRARTGEPSHLLLAGIVVSVALFGSFLWEIFEFSLWKMTPNYATITRFYSPSVSDTLSDMMYGTVGGLIVAALHAHKRRKRARQK